VAVGDISNIFNKERGFTMRNALIWLSSVGVLLLAVSCADVPNAPEILGEPTAAAEVAEIGNPLAKVNETAQPVQVADENLLILDPSTVTVLKDSDLKTEKYSVANISQKRLGKPFPTNVKQLNPEKTISFSAKDAVVTRKTNALAKTTALSDPGFYLPLSGFLTGTGSFVRIESILIDPGEVLCVQVDMPNSAQIDYDVRLYEVNAFGDWILVDVSDNATFINPPYGTVPEAVGVYNRGNVTKEYLVLIYSYQGGSTTLPFTAHFGIRANNALFDSKESDEHYQKATVFDFNVPNPRINSRSANTLCDNDWFTFVSPYDLATLFTLDAASVSAGYKLEVYDIANNGGLRITPTNNGRVLIRANTQYYIRVTSTGANSLTGTNYTITLYPDYTTNNIKITDYTGGNGYYAYCSTPNRYEVERNGQFTVKGITCYKFSDTLAIGIPSVDVTFTFYNPYYGSAYGGKMSTIVTSNSSGNFTATLPVGPAMGDITCTYRSPFTITDHDYDLKAFTLMAGNVTRQEIIIVHYRSTTIVL
jgi:hypothetical protein